MSTLDIDATSFFAWLLRTTLQGSLLICLILLLKLILRDRLRPRWQVMLWLILLVRLSLPWAPQSQWSIYNLLHGSYWTELAASPRQGGVEQRPKPRSTLTATTAGTASGEATIQASPPEKEQPAGTALTDVPSVDAVTLARIFHVICVLVSCAEPNCLYSKG